MSRLSRICPHKGAYKAQKTHILRRGYNANLINEHRLQQAQDMKEFLTQSTESREGLADLMRSTI